MVNELLKTLSEDSLNRFSFSSVTRNEDDPLSNASPCKDMKHGALNRNNLATSDSGIFSSRFPQIYRNNSNKHSGSTHSLGRKQRPPPPLDRPNLGLFRSEYLESPTDSVQSFHSTISLTPTSSVSELDSDLGTPLRAEAGSVDIGGLNELSLEGASSITAGQFCRGQNYHRVNRSVLGFSHNNIANNSLLNGWNHLHEDHVDYSQGTSPQKQSKSRSGISRRPSMWVPQQKVRRTQSMFATPDQMLHEQQLGFVDQSPTDQSVAQGLNVLGSVDCPVPTFTARQDSFPRISSATLCRIIDKEFSDLFSECVVIDCRFEYEYEGGHIGGAINVNSKQQLEQVMFHQRSCDPSKRVLLVFHCEHSAYRSPLLAAHLRHCDREINSNRYPNLYYPDVAVLDGGYSDFYKKASQRCEPQNYIRMNHQEHQNTCEREMNKFRTGMKAKKFHSFGLMSTPQISSFRFPDTVLRSASAADLSEPK